MLENILDKSGLDYLHKEDFEEKTPGRFFQKEKVDLGNGLKQFIVVLGPNIKSPIHNHQGENLTETHLLLWGSGRFIIYEDGEESELILEKGKFHEIFTTPLKNPDHKYIAGPEGSITLALEKIF